jgi:hypothetical protein
MKLHWLPRPPFVHTVMILHHETGLTRRVGYADR